MAASEVEQQLERDAGVASGALETVADVLGESPSSSGPIGIGRA